MSAALANVDWQQVWSSFIGTIGGTAVLLAVATFIARSFFANWLTRQLERFKADLQLEVQSRLKRFTYLHDERARTIKSFYVLVIRTDKAFLNLSQKWHLVYADEARENDSEDGELDESKITESVRPFREAVKLYVELDEFYDENKLYLPMSSRQVIEKLRTTYADVLTAKHQEARSASLAEIHRAFHLPATQGYVEDVMEQADKAQRLMRDEASAVIIELEKSFQEILES